MLSLKDLNLEKMSPEELGELLIEAKKAYYTGGKPIMDDATYDTLEDILKEKNPYHRIFQKIGHENFDTGFPKKAHAYILGSQNKVNNFSDLKKYYQLKKVPESTDFILQPKCDGLSLEIEYRQGRVVDAITRGDGRVGDVITQNVTKMQNFREALSKPITGSVRCEIIVTYKDFDRLNQISDESYSNPRNAASGISQRLDGKYSRFCTLLAVDLFSPELKLQFEHQKIDTLKELGLTPVETIFCPDLVSVEKSYQHFLREKRQNYQFDIDGLVVKIDSLELQSNLGSKNNRPKGQVAYKFPSATNSSRLKDIIWQTGPLGSVTPIAQIDPIVLSGAVITFASLANYDLIREKNINIGDIVQVSRRGDVIPHIEGVVTKVASGHLLPPKACPDCGTALQIDNKYIRCPNTQNCPSQTLGALKLFCAALDIKGISAKTIEKLVRAGKVKLPGDFYDLQVDDFINLEGLGEKSGKNIIHEIQKKRELTLKQAFDSAIIPNFSSARIKQVIDAGFDTAPKIKNLSVSDLEALPGFRSTLAAKVISGLNQREDFIDSILSKVKIKNETIGDNLVGLSFAITGQLSRPRKDIENDIIQAGGKTVSAVTQNTSYLVTNETDSSSSKFQTAQKLGVKIISENELQKLLTS